MTGKTADLTQGEGARIWQELMLRVRTARIEEPRFGAAQLVRPRLGQGAFRVLVTDSYDRRCALSGERTLPVLQAAHIKPYAVGGMHLVENGVLFRSDIHMLFDRGYVTVTPEHPRRVRERPRLLRVPRAPDSAAGRRRAPPRPRSAKLAQRQRLPGVRGTTVSTIGHSQQASDGRTVLLMGHADHNRRSRISNMALDPGRLLAEALKLSPAARAALAASLLESLDEEIDEGAEAALGRGDRKRLPRIGLGGGRRGSVV